MDASFSCLSPQSGRRLLLRTVTATAAAGVASGRAQGAGAGLGLALGSGSLHGYAHLGILKALESRGLRPKVIAGTSAGAIAGSLWAFGLSWDRIHRATAGLGWWRGQRLSLERGLLRNDVVRDLVDRLTSGVPLQRWPTRFAAVATDFSSGRKVVLAEGAAGPAVQASCSLPLLYEPVRLGEQVLVDGGLSEPIPIRTARELGAQTVIAIDIAYRPSEAPMPGLGGTPLHAFHVLVDRLISEQIREADLAIRLDVHRLVSTTDDHVALIAAGERAIVERWSEIVALLAR